MNITDIFFQSNNNTEVVANASNKVLAHQITNILAGGGTPVMLIVAGCMIFYYNKVKGNANTSNGFFRWLGRSAANFCRGFLSSENNNTNDVEAANIDKKIFMYDLSNSHLQNISVNFLIDAKGDLVSGKLMTNEAVKKISFSKTKENMYTVTFSTESDNEDCTDYVNLEKDNKDYEEKDGTISLLEGGDTFQLIYETSKGTEIIPLIGLNYKDFFTQPSQPLVESEAVPLMELDQSLVR